MSINKAAQELTAIKHSPKCVNTVCFAHIMLIECTHTHRYTHSEIMCQVSLWIEVTVTVESDGVQQGSIEGVFSK